MLCTVFQFKSFPLMFQTSTIWQKRKFRLVKKIIIILSIIFRMVCHCRRSFFFLFQNVKLGKQCDLIMTKLSLQFSTIDENFCFPNDISSEKIDLRLKLIKTVLLHNLELWMDIVLFQNMVCRKESYISKMKSSMCCYRC